MAESGPEVPALISQSGKPNGARWILDRRVMVIGRSPECDVVIPDRQVSRRHARLRRTEEGYLLEDLRSKNGTFVNGVPVEEPVLLRDGDVVQVALAAKIVFVGTEATMPLAGGGASGMESGKLRMDPQAHRVWVGQVELDPPLSPPQYKLLELLCRRSGRVVTRDEIVEAVWPETGGEGVSEQAIDALVRRLRDRLAELDREHAYLVTVRGHGFRLDNPA